jgi:hypothetical protein
MTARNLLIMQITTTLSLWSLAFGSVIANIQIEYWSGSASCRDDSPAEILHFQRESGGSCIKGSSEYNTYKVHSTNEDEPINTCQGPYKDSACTELVHPSIDTIRFKCDACTSTGDSYIWVE